MTAKEPVVKVTFLQPGWTSGMEYSENCGMCQERGVYGGLGRMIPIPTTQVRLNIAGTDETREVFLCHACITAGLKSGELQAENEMPPGCPFSMG